MPRKGDNSPSAPPNDRKDMVSEVAEEEDAQDSEYDTDDLADLPTELDSEGAKDELPGIDPDPEGDL